MRLHLLKNQISKHKTSHHCKISHCRLCGLRSLCLNRCWISSTLTICSGSVFNSAWRNEPVCIFGAQHATFEPLHIKRMTHCLPFVKNRAACHYYPAHWKAHTGILLSSAVSQSITASPGSIMTHCSGIEGHWWPGLIVSAPCLPGWTESLLIYIRLIPATTYVSTVVTKERCTCWFFAQRLIDLVRPRYQQKRDIITFVLKHSGTFQRGAAEGELSHWECVSALN